MTLLEQKNEGRDTLPLNQRALEVLRSRIKVRQPGCQQPSAGASHGGEEVGNWKNYGFPT